MALDALPTFLDELEARETVFSQDFPADVIPIERGIPRELEGLVAQ